MNRQLLLHLVMFLAFFSIPCQSQLPGPPPNPDVFSAMSALMQQVPLESPQPAAKPKGNVAELIWEDFQSDPHDRTKATNFSKRLVIRYDQEQREVEQTESADPRGFVTKTVSVYRNGLLESKRFERSKDGKLAGTPSYLRWRYDAKGNVVDFQRGPNGSPENHFLNYQYDPQGRPTGWVYQQEANEFVSTTKIRYSGNTVETSTFDEHGEKTSMQLQTLDPAGHVSDLEVYERSSKENTLKLLYHSRFQFDSQGRVIQQETDPYNFEAGDDYQPYPGKLVVHYDDVAHTREQRFYDSNGTLAFRNLAELDRDNIVCSLRVFDSTGKERQEGELFPSGTSLVPVSRPGKTRWEVDYDKQGNWTERRRYFYPADGSDRLLMHLARQTIQYR